MITGIGSSNEQSSVYQLVQQYMVAERLPLQRLEQSKASFGGNLTAFSDLASRLREVRSSLEGFRWSGSLTPLNSFAGTSSSEAVGLTVSGSASEGSHLVQVHSLARAHSVASNAFVGSEPTSLGGAHTFELRQGDETHKIAVDVDLEATNREALRAIVTAINDSEARVTASLVRTDSRTDEYRILLTSKDTGTDAIIHGVSDVGAGKLAMSIGLAGASEKLNFAANTVQEAADATFSIDGLEFVSSTNRVSDALLGVTLELNNVTADPTMVTIERDVESVKEKVGEWLAAYNQLVDFVREQTQGAGSDGAGRGRLTGNSLFMNLRSNMRLLATTPVADETGLAAFTHLAQIGITADREGHLSISDNDLFEDSLLTKSAGIERLFRDENDGVAVRLTDLIDAYVKSGGLITQERSAISGRQRLIDQQIASQEAYLIRREEQLTGELGALQATLYELSSQSSYLSMFGNNTSLNSFLTGGNS